MTDLLSRLRALQTNIRVGVIGTGNIGKGIVQQVGTTPGMECVLVADVYLERAIASAAQLKRPWETVDSLARLHDVVRAGKTAVCADGLLAAGCELIDVMVDATSAVPEGADFALAAIANGKHVVMMNSEADLAFGPYLMAQARRAGVVYTSADGDQHTVLKRVINDIELWGFTTVMAGNMKGYLDRYAHPGMIVPEADKRSLDYKMCTSYTDGTKVCIEMALTANAIGGRTAAVGMLGPRVKDIYDIFQHFDFEALWDGKTPLVDYVLGAYPPGGVFVIGYNDNPHQMETLRAYLPCRLGPGPFYLFHRPYHLGHIEVTPCIAEAYLDGWAVLQPTYGLLTDVYAYAKKDLRAGEVVDGIGGYAAYGLIENCADNAACPGLPIALSEGLVLRRDIAKDEKIMLSDVVVPLDHRGFALYREAQRALEG